MAGLARYGCRAEEVLGGEAPGVHEVEVGVGKEGAEKLGGLPLFTPISAMVATSMLSAQVMKERYVARWLIVDSLKASCHSMGSFIFTVVSKNYYVKRKGACAEGG